MNIMIIDRREYKICFQKNKEDKRRCYMQVMEDYGIMEGGLSACNT